MLVLYVSNSILSLVIQLITMVYIVIASPRAKRGMAMWYGAFFMLLANIFGLCLVTPGGPSFCVGLVFFPLYGMLLACISLCVSEWLKGIRKKRKRRSAESVKA